MHDSDDGAAREQTSGTIASAIKAIVSLTGHVITGRASRRQIAVFGVAVFAIVALVLVSVVLGGEGFAIGFSFVVSLCLFILILISLAVPSATPSLWSCVVPEMPISGPALDKLGRLVEEMRMLAYRHLHAGYNDLKNEQVRANVFLADYNLAGEGYAFQLVMPDDLRKEMNRPEEWAMRLKPRQGLTGRVFAEGSMGIAHRRSNADGHWDAVYELTDELKKIVHPDLKWIVSFPIRDPSKNITLAVLNIDGLSHDFNDDLLSNLATTVFTLTSAFATCLAKQPQVAVSLTVAEIQS